MLAIRFKHKYAYKNVQIGLTVSHNQGRSYQNCSTTYAIKLNDCKFLGQFKPPITQTYCSPNLFVSINIYIILYFFFNENHVTVIELYTKNVCVLSETNFKNQEFRNNCISVFLDQIRNMSACLRRCSLQVCHDIPKYRNISILNCI